MGLQGSAVQLRQRLQGLPALFQDAFLTGLKILNRAAGASRLPGLRSAFRYRKPQSACGIVGEDFFLRDFLLYEEFDVLGNEPIGGELADHTEGPPVHEPLGAHTESNGSHEITPWG